MQSSRREGRAEKAKLLRLLYGSRRAAWGWDPGAYDARAVEKTLQGVVGKLFRDNGYFAMEARGWEHVPESPVMVVANHSGGTSIPDVWGLLVAWYRRFGAQRPIHPMAHDLLLANGIMGPYCAKRGILRAHRQLALEVLRDWRRDLLVLPGGDRETWRPYRERHNVNFYGRCGYARLALRAGVPIVPVAHVGAHETLIVLSDGHRIARMLRIGTWARAEVFPIHLSLPYGLCIGPWPHVPIPRRFRYRVGKPIWPPEGWRRQTSLTHAALEVAAHGGGDGGSAGGEPPPDVVEAHDRTVRQALQRLLNELRDN